MITRQRLLKLSLICLVIGVAVLLIAYFFFHFVTDDGITLTWHPEAGKPFVSELLGDLGVLFIFTSALGSLSSFVFFDGKEE